MIWGLSPPDAIMVGCVWEGGDSNSITTRRCPQVRMEALLLLLFRGCCYCW